MPTSPTSGPGGGGSSAAIQTRAQYDGNAVTIANGASARLTWDRKDVGDALLDISTPDLPTTVAAGVYAVSVLVRPAGALTPGGFYSVKLELDRNGDDPLLVEQFAATAANPNPHGALTLVYYSPAGGQIRLTATNVDGVASQDFALTGASVQRLS